MIYDLKNNGFTLNTDKARFSCPESRVDGIGAWTHGTTHATLYKARSAWFIVTEWPGSDYEAERVDVRTAVAFLVASGVEPEPGMLAKGLDSQRRTAAYFAGRRAG